MFFKSAGSISQNIFIQSTLNFAHFVIRLSSKIRTGFFIVKIVRLMVNFFCEKYKLRLYTLHKFISIQYFENLMRILLDLFIRNKKFFLQHLFLFYCQPQSTSSSEALQPSFKKKNYKEFFFIYFKICSINAFSHIS